MPFSCILSSLLHNVVEILKYFCCGLPLHTNGDRSIPKTSFSYISIYILYIHHGPEQSSLLLIHTSKYLDIYYPTHIPTPPLHLYHPPPKKWILYIYKNRLYGLAHAPSKLRHEGVPYKVKSSPPHVLQATHHALPSRPFLLYIINQAVICPFPLFLLSFFFLLREREMGAK